MAIDKPRRLLVISSAIHHYYDGQAFAYGPYAREIDAWADLFESVEIAAPCSFMEPPGDCIRFSRENIRVRPLPVTGGKSSIAKMKQFTQVPYLSLKLIVAMRQSDALHVRCPGNLGLLGAIFGPMFSRYRVAKYAGQWNGYEGERFAVRLQRRLLASSWWGQPVTVYGEWPDQPAHVKSFFTSMMSDDHVENAVRVADNKRIGKPLEILFSGRLAPEKRVDALLKAIAIVRDAKHDVELVIVGDGSERETLEALAKELDIQSLVRFVGAVPFEQGLQWYEFADCLVLPSRHSEGWPKVLAEAMCHGLACIAVKHGQIPRMLAGRGTLLDDGTPEEIAYAIVDIVEDPVRHQNEMRAASEWSRNYSLPRLRDALAKLLSDEWGLDLQVHASGTNRPMMDEANHATELSSQQYT